MELLLHCIGTACDAGVTLLDVTFGFVLVFPVWYLYEKYICIVHYTRGFIFFLVNPKIYIFCIALPLSVYDRVLQSLTLTQAGPHLDPSCLLKVLRQIEYITKCSVEQLKHVIHTPSTKQGMSFTVYYCCSYPSTRNFNSFEIYIFLPKMFFRFATCPHSFGKYNKDQTRNKEIILIYISKYKYMLTCRQASSLRSFSKSIFGTAQTAFACSLYTVISTAATVAMFWCVHVFISLNMCSELTLMGLTCDYTVSALVLLVYPRLQNCVKHLPRLDSDDSFQSMASDIDTMHKQWCLDTKCEKEKVRIPCAHFLCSTCQRAG